MKNAILLALFLFPALARAQVYARQESGLASNMTLSNVTTIRHGSVIEKFFSNGSSLSSNTIPPYAWEYIGTNGVRTIGTNQVTKQTISANGDITTAGNLTFTGFATTNGGLISQYHGGFWENRLATWPQGSGIQFSAAPSSPEILFVSGSNNDSFFIHPNGELEAVANLKTTFLQVLDSFSSDDGAISSDSQGNLTAVSFHGDGSELDGVANTNTVIQLITNSTIAIGEFVTLGVTNVIVVLPNSNAVPGHLGFGAHWNPANSNIVFDGSAPGGASALSISNYFNVNTNQVIVDLSQVQMLTLCMMTNVNNVKFTNIWALTNYHDMQARFHTWEGTNGVWRILSMSVAGGLIRTNGTQWQGTNASEYDVATLSLDGTLTNLIISWSSNVLQGVSFTNTLFAGGGGGGGGGAFTYTFITNVSLSVSANGLATSTAIDCRDANLTVLSYIHLGGTFTAFTADKNANTYQAGTIYHNAGNNVFCQQFYCTNGTFDSSMTWTVEMTGGGGYPTLMVSLYKKTVSGVAATPLFDKQSGLNGTDGSSTTWTIPQVTPASDSSLVVANTVLGDSFSQNINSFADGSQTFTEVRKSLGYGTFYLIQSTAAAVGPTIIWDAAGIHSAGSEIIFH